MLIQIYYIFLFFLNGSVLNGFNSALFAYGQTGSGKVLHVFLLDLV
jgi:hypothetical protein